MEYKAAAYVSYTQYEGDDLKTSNTHIRLCPPIWTTPYPNVSIGITIFHELIHMTSGVIDYGYDKMIGYNLAKSEPEKARLNA